MLIRRLAALAGVTAAVLAVTPPLAGADEPNRGGIVADYYGKRIDMSEGWSGAQACAIDEMSGVCFDTEAELDAFLRESNQVTGVRVQAACSSSTRLYAGTSYGTPVLAITVRLSWQDLSAAGFDNLTRSYKIGGCATSLAKNTGGGGGAMTAGAGTQASTMPSGWDRVISSVYIS